MTAAILAALAQTLVVAAGAPLLAGAHPHPQGPSVGRRGPSPWQPYADLVKLLQKERWSRRPPRGCSPSPPMSWPRPCWWRRSVVPVIVTRPALAFAGNVILLMYLFMLGTFFLALAGLDSGSAFGGMGSSRGVAVAALAEPTIMLAVFALAIRTGTTNLGGMAERIGGDPVLAAHPGHLLAFFAFFIVMVAENGRLPVDNPATHLELTMIHEAMVLEYSGHYLALVEWAGAMKLFLFLTLLVNLFFPWWIPTEAGGVAHALGRAGAGGQARAARHRPRRARDGGGQAPALPRARAARRVVRAGRPLGGLGGAPQVTATTNLLTFFALVVTLLLVWRQSWPGRLRLFVAQSVLLALLAAAIGWFAGKPALLVVALVFSGSRRGSFRESCGAWPRALRCARWTPATRAASRCWWRAHWWWPPTSIILPVTATATLPTAGAIPLAFAMALIGLFVCVTGRDVLGQVLGFLVLRERNLRPGAAGHLRPARSGGGRRLPRRAGDRPPHGGRGDADPAEHDSIDVDRLRELRG